MHGMNKAKKVYYDDKGNMVKNTNYKDKSKLIKSEIESGTVVHKKCLKLVNISWLNMGVTFWFKDENGRLYPMTDSVFWEYVKSNPIDFGDKDIEFLQRGSVYSIGFVEGDKQ